MLPSMYTNAAENAEYIKELSRGFVDAYMLFNVHENDHYVETFHKYNIPFMCFGNLRPRQANNFVGTDYTAGVMNAVEHFFSHKIYDITIFPGLEDTIVARQMQDGYTRAFAKNHIPWGEKNIIKNFDRAAESAYNEMVRLLSEKDSPRAFILTEEYYYDLLKAASTLKLKMYEDVKVIVINYYPPVVDPAVTHLKVSRYLVGKTAAEKLIDLLEGKKIDPCVFSMEFVLGNSCGCGS
jgi:DNA-binding LacI/PurR family transcriptional regulator